MRKANLPADIVAKRFLDSVTRICRRRGHPCYYCEMRIRAGDRYVRFSDYFSHWQCAVAENGALGKDVFHAPEPVGENH